MATSNLFQICLAIIVTFNCIQLITAQDRCDALPLEPVDLQLLLSNSPFIDHYALVSTFNCTQQIFSGAARGTTGYDGTAVVLQKNFALVYQFVIAADGESADSVICSTGQQDHWNFLKFQLTSDGGWLCIFVCSSDGASFAEFLCMGTDSSYIADETQALSLVSGVSNAGSIFDAYSSCPQPQNCAIFY